MSDTDLLDDPETLAILEMERRIAELEKAPDPPE